MATIANGIIGMETIQIKSTIAFKICIFLIIIIIKEKRGCLKNMCYLITQIKLIETDIDYQYVKIFRQAQYDIKLYFSDSLFEILYSKLLNNTCF